jgi:hypothetical protein
MAFTCSWQNCHYNQQQQLTQCLTDNIMVLNSTAVPKKQRDTQQQRPKTTALPVSNLVPHVPLLL